jgi:hypothetical protein
VCVCKYVCVFATEPLFGAWEVTKKKKPMGSSASEADLCMRACLCICICVSGAYLRMMISWKAWMFKRPACVCVSVYVFTCVCV